jgi:hypothetical protein
MAFNIQSWGRISGSANNFITVSQSGASLGAPNIFTYISATDALATISAANYFATVVSEVNVGDFIYAVDSTFTTEIYTITAINVQAKTITVATAGGVVPAFPLSMALGGTGANLVPVAGGAVYSGAAALAITAAPTATGQILSGTIGGAAPVFTTATYPRTTTINQILYSSAANTITGIATANSSVLVTSAGGVPSISATLPNGLAMGTPASLVLTNATGLPIAGLTGLGTGVATALAANVNGSGAISLTTSPTFVTPILGVAAATSLQLGANGLLDTNGNEMLKLSATASAVNQWQIANAATNGKPILQAIGSDANVIGQLQGQGTGHVEIQGTTTNDSATAGYVGELIAANVLAGAAISISNNTPANVTSISLTAGDWDVTGNVTVTGSSGILTNVTMWGSTASATLPDASTSSSLTSTIFTQLGSAIPRFRFRSTSTTTVYLSVQASFATGTATACGTIYARRVR